MYSLKFILALLIVLEKFESFRGDIIQNNTECLIRNQQYQYEYLSSKNIMNQHLGDDLAVNENRVFTYLLPKVNDYHNLKWVMVNAQNGSFYIQSVNKRMRLCASVNFSDTFRMRRVLMLVGIDNNHAQSSLNNDDHCMWNLESTNKQNTTYFIRNRKYASELMYAASNLFNKNKDVRNVYTWSGKLKINTKKFVWSFDCQKGLFLLA